MAVHPARILGVDGGGLRVGGPADLTVLAPETTTEVSTASFRSMGHNTPFDGWSLRARRGRNDHRRPRPSTQTTGWRGAGAFGAVAAG